MRRWLEVLLAVIVSVYTACVSHNTKADPNANLDSNHSKQATAANQTQPFPAGFRYAQLLDRYNWLIGDFYDVWKTEDGGETWHRIYGIERSYNSRVNIKGFSFIDEKTGFLATNQNLLRTTDGGASWNEVAAIKSRDEESSINNIYFLDSLRGWAVGLIWQKDFLIKPTVSQYIGAVFATQDGGQTWQHQRLNIPKGFFKESDRWALEDVFFRDANNGWVVGDGVIFWTKDGGESWHLAKAKSAQYRQVEFLNAQLGWATQREGAGFAITTDGGQRWKFLEGPPAFGTWPAHIVFLTTQYGFATLISLYETKDGGQSWKWRTGGNSEQEHQYDYIGRARDGTLTVLGISRETITALVSTDNGLTWQPSNFNLQNVR